MNNNHCRVSIVESIVDWVAIKEIMGRIEEATLKMVSQQKLVRQVNSGIKNDSQEW